MKNVVLPDALVVSTPQEGRTYGGPTNRIISISLRAIGVFEGTTWGTVLLVNTILKVWVGHTVETNLGRVESIWWFWKRGSGVV